MNNRDRLNEIEQLTERLNRLELEFRRETTEIHRAIATLSEEDQDTIRIGALVEITNSYKGNRGKRGIVHRITRTRVYFYEERNDNRLVEHIRAHKNLRVITDQNE